jgi:hypothetical protein
VAGFCGSGDDAERSRVRPEAAAGQHDHGREAVGAEERPAVGIGRCRGGGAHGREEDDRRAGDDVAREQELDRDPAVELREREDRQAREEDAEEEADAAEELAEDDLAVREVAGKRASCGPSPRPIPRRRRPV